MFRAKASVQLRNPTALADRNRDTGRRSAPQEIFRSTFVHQGQCTAWSQTALAERRPLQIFRVQFLSDRKVQRHRSEASSHVIKCRFVLSAVTYPHFIVPTKKAALKKGALHQSRNERDGHWVLGRTIPDLKLSLQLKRHICIELSCLDPRIVRRVRPFPGCPARAQS